jgi:cystathionine gamma-synthase/cystathionine gamma-lyase
MIDKNTKLGADTLAIHAGQEADPTSGAVMTPIVLSSTFAQAGPGRHKGYEYSRSGNPTRNALEACIAALEGGTHGFAFGSGSGATTTLIHALGQGGHAVSGDDVYGGTFRIFDKIMKPLGMESTFVDMTNVDNVKKAMRPNTKLIWLETPSNPLLKIFDIRAIAEIGKAAGVPVFVDNTFATPILQKPLELGATAVIHSTTKYINGHSDVVGGAVVTSDDGLAERLRFLQNAIGAVPSPFDCYMVLRGIKTLPVRMRQHVASAKSLAERLTRHPSVRRVFYPGLAKDPGYALAARQMKGPGGMISFEMDGGLVRAQKMLENLRIFACAESLGGVESLAEHPASMTHASIPREIREKIGISDGLVRLSVGLEAEDDLWADIESALASASAV